MSEARDRLKEMVTPDGFVRVWRDECNQGETLTDTFERLNRIYEDEYGRPRYSDYNSFRNSRDRD